ncbi:MULTISPECIES: hypothetical protein [Myroides]|uniref:Uncharacterized protein n=1 Tax=Myroides albus TaxID=2562892 RepID=A0A6I3LH61_9FLAO|nr:MULTISPECIES: hypothetical protein [Myroides]MTG98909.1 hypothetical protein [Myroides albus]MVX37186.1 hypothetical protein [Myroides sp. LoEW2-1]UVD79996.1 hypothetical protein NWE55_01510 [Myroides albus]
MRIALWVYISLVLVGSLITFIPSIMSLGSPSFGYATKKEKIKVRVSKTFLIGALVYPIVFIISLFIKHFFDIDVLYFLTGYATVLIALLAFWFFSE